MLAMKSAIGNVTWAVLLGFLLAVGAASAEPRVQALFPGKALFLLDGERFLLRDGEAGPGGLRLLRATSQDALVEYAGRERRMELERGHFAGAYQARSLPELRIPPDAFGGYVIAGVVNAQSVRFVVDTGATLITLSEREADRLRLSRTEGMDVVVETASGQVTGRRILLERVQVGELVEHRVPAVVLPGDRPTTALLGMSFLSRLDIRNEGPTLVLQAR